ncbi:MAG TPA: hypothetical protein VK400_16795 [Pyrinomonadaceae bacterium]|nr:hypothetical protein [Pyrinomonadaceae bacterium]
MNRIIFIAVLIFSFLVITLPAQTTRNDNVLVDGNPPLTQSMVEKSRDVFEFTFGGALNEDEKRIYQAELIKRWQINDAETIKAVQDLAGFHDKVSGLGREKLLVLQKEMREPLVKDLRAQSEKDALAKMLVGAFDRIQGLNARQGGALPPPTRQQQQQSNVSPSGNSQAVTGGGNVPREILGEWVKSNTSLLSYGNGYGGYSSPSGEKVIMRFFADGTYKAAYYVQSSMSVGCTMNVFMPSSGVFSVEGNTLKLFEKTSRTFSKDTCVARYNYEKNNKPGSYAYPARLERDEYGLKLVLTMNDGNHNFYFNTGQSFLN